MPIEIEKKYRLTTEQRELLPQRLLGAGARLEGDTFEENTIFNGESLKPGRSVLRLRRVAGQAILTYKERLPSATSIKHQREEETVVSDPDATHEILASLGFSRALVYEKHRQTWHLREVEIVIDELPFGWFMEIEGTEAEISAVERELDLADLIAEEATYPQLALKAGTRCGEVIEARFAPR